MKCVDGDGLEVMRLYVEPGDAVTFRSEGRAWSVDFGKLSPFEVARIEGGPRDTVTVQVEEETFTGVEYRYFASLRDPQEGGLRVRIQPLIRVEAYAMPISW